MNERGEVIGIVVSSLSEGQNLNFAVPVALFDEIKEMNGSNPRDWVWGSGTPTEATTEVSKTDCPKVETNLVFDDDKSLEGLKGIKVLVEKLPLEIARLISTESITAQTEATLRKYGIKVVNENYNEPGIPLLYLNLNCIETAGSGFACSLNLELQQLARSEVIKSSVFYGATTWRQSTKLTTSRSSARSFVLESIDEMVISFVNDYLKVNR